MLSRACTFEGSASNYSQPNSGSPSSQIGYLNISSTGVRGGGVVRAVVRPVQAGPPATTFLELDRIAYVDRNVPCTKPYVAQWFFGDANPDAAKWTERTPVASRENHIYGWYAEATRSDDKSREPGTGGCKDKY